MGDTWNQLVKAAKKAVGKEDTEGADSVEYGPQAVAWAKPHQEPIIPEYVDKKQPAPLYDTAGNLTSWDDQKQLQNDIYSQEQGIPVSQARTQTSDFGSPVQSLDGMALVQDKADRLGQSISRASPGLSEAAHRANAAIERLQQKTVPQGINKVGGVAKKVGAGAPNLQGSVQDSDLGKKAQSVLNRHFFDPQRAKLGLPLSLQGQQEALPTDEEQSVIDMRRQIDAIKFAQEQERITALREKLNASQ